MSTRLYGALASRCIGLKRTAAAQEIAGSITGGTLALRIGTTVIGSGVITAVTNTRNEVLSSPVAFVLTQDAGPDTVGLNIKYTASNAEEGFISDVDGVVVTMANSLLAGQTVSVRELTWGNDADSDLQQNYPPANFTNVRQWLLRNGDDEPEVVADTIVGQHFHGWPLAGELPPHYRNEVSPTPTYRYGSFISHNNSEAGFLARLFPNEESQGEFDAIEAVYRGHKARGAKIVDTNFAMPAWLSALGNYEWGAYPSYPGGAGSPVDWDVFADRLAKKIWRLNKGPNINSPLIDYMESWNETDLNFMSTAEADFGPTFWSGPNVSNDAASIAARRVAAARMQQVVYEVCKDVDPNIVVLTPGFVWWWANAPELYLNFLNTQTGAGGKAGDYFDAYSGHHYDSDTSSGVAQYIARMKQLEYIQSVFDPSKPMFQTETGLLHGNYMTVAAHATSIRRKVLATAGMRIRMCGMYSADAVEGGQAPGGGAGFALSGGPSYSPTVSAGMDQAFEDTNGKTLIDCAELNTGQIRTRWSDLSEVLV